MDEQLAASATLVVAIDLRLADKALYPACVADASCGIRCLKSECGDFNGEPETLGALGSSSGRQVSELCALRPHQAGVCFARFRSGLKAG